MSAGPLVSVLVPAYNAERFIVDAVRSALEQTHTNLEVIVVDDGSRDQTGEVLKKFGNDPRVLCRRQENGGASAARNHCYRLAQGQFLQWLDADDLLAPDKVARQLAIWRQFGEPENVLFGGSWVSFFKNHKKGQKEQSGLYETETPVDWLRVKMLTNAWNPPEPWLTHRVLAENAGPWDERLMRDNDGDYFRRVVAAADRIHHIPEILSFYRRAVSGSISSDLNLSPEKLRSLAMSLQRHVQTLRELDDSARSLDACAVFLRRWLYFFWPEMEQEFSALRKVLEELGYPDAKATLPGKYQRLVPILGWNRSKRLYFGRPRVGTLKSTIKEALRKERY